MRVPLGGDIAVITGAGSAEGIGFAVATQLGLSGARIAITSTTERIHQRAKELRELGIDAIGFIADLIDEGQVDGLFSFVESRFGSTRILVNNAGMGSLNDPESFELITSTPLGSWTKSLERNVTTAFLATKRSLPEMIAHSYGRIINVASTTGPVQVKQGEEGYAAAKAAMVGLTRATAIENARFAITANAVAPGWIATAAQRDDEARHGLASPMGRSGRAAEVAAAITFLASEGASFISGQLLVVDGANSLVEGHGGYDIFSS